MKLVIDLDQHAAIQDFAIGAPASVYDFKSQDTIDWMIYFVRGGVVQDLGSGMAIKYGMIVTGDATNTLLAYQTAFTYLTDPAGNVYYNCQVVYNTSQMASAISGKSQLTCTSEVRYQTSDNEIIHSLNISCLVFPTILVETGVTPPGVSTGYPDASTIELLVHKNAVNGYAGLDAQGDLTGSIIPVDNQTIAVNSAGDIASAAILATTAANFTTPAANVTVTVTFVSTSNLKAGSYVRIPIAGYYIVQSITNATTAVLQNNGDPFNAASGTTITSGAVVLPAQAAAGGGAAGANAYDTTAASFTVPAAGASVTVQMHSTAWLGGTGYIIFIQSAGYYSLVSITDGANASFNNLGYSVSNAAPGTVIASGSRISPGGVQGAAGAGATGANAYDATTAAFTMPAAAATVTVAISNTGWTGVGQELYIAGAGYFNVNSIMSPTVLLLTNSNYPGAAAPGATIASGSKVSPAGVIGPAGAGGAGLNAFTTLSASFTQPAVAATVTATVGTTAWIAVGQAVYVVGGGYYQVSSVGDSTHVTISNFGYAGNANPGATVASGGGVSPAGLAGQGGNSFTTTNASYTQPAVGSNVTVTLVNTAWMVQNQYVFINGGGTYQVVNINDTTHAVLQSVAATGNSLSGTVVATGSGVSPSGSAGPQGPTGATGASGPQESLGAHLETPTAKTYTVDLAASSTYTIKAFKCILGAGTLTLALVQNGSNISGAGAISVSTTLSVTTLTQAVALNDKIQITLSSISSATDLQFTMWIQR